MRIRSQIKMILIFKSHKHHKAFEILKTLFVEVNRHTNLWKKRFRILNQRFKRKNKAKKSSFPRFYNDPNQQNTQKLITSNLDYREG